MSQTENKKAIISLELNLKSKKGRNELREIIRIELKKYNHQEISVFASRVALRAAWSLEKYKVKDKSKLDRFYFYWLRALTAAVTINLIYTNKSRKAAAYAASDAYAYAAADAYAYAYAAANTIFVLEQLNADLSSLDKTTVNKPLWLPKFNIHNDPKLSELDSFWTKYLFSPALSGELFQTENNKLFFKGFLNLPEEVLKNKSAKEMQRFIEDYIKGKTSTTNSARLILLGHGGSGKTSIVKKLCGESLEPYEKATPRIQVRDLSINKEENKEIILSIWDFGGQVIMHSTHSFFISSRSTYIIACNQRANEQPDPWLKLLQGRVSKSKIITVLIVYTHCDTAEQYASNEIEGNQRSTIAPWRRDNALQRKFGQSFDLKFFNIDLDPGTNPKEKELSGFNELKTEIRSRAIAESETQMTAGVNEVKKLVEKLEKDDKPFICHQDLVTKLKDIIAIDDSVQVFKTANHYGYIFPEQPLKEDEPVDDDFIWVSQKHWLSYGVYCLINNIGVINHNGILTQELIDQALSIDKPLAINNEGEIEQRKVKKDEESLLYDSDGIIVLKQILVNYRWAMSYHKRHNELLLPLATSLDEPKTLIEFAKVFEKTLETGEPSCLLMQIELGNKPADFFFKLATYLEPHLSETDDLWRTGAILHFYGSHKTRALIEIPDNILILKVLGEDRQSFQQLLLINIKETLKSYENISAHSSEQVWVDGKSKMLSSDVIASLTSDSGIVQKIKDQLMEKGRNMTTININGNVTGNIGDSNTFDNKGDINNQTINMDSKGAELIEQLQKLSVAMPIESKEKQGVDQSIVLFEEAAKETDQPKKESLYRQAVEFAKDAVAVDKFAGLYMEYLPKINEILNTIL